MFDLSRALQAAPPGPASGRNLEALGASAGTAGQGLLHVVPQTVATRLVSRRSGSAFRVERRPMSARLRYADIRVIFHFKIKVSLIFQ